MDARQTHRPAKSSSRGTTTLPSFLSLFLSFLSIDERSSILSLPLFLRRIDLQTPSLRGGKRGGVRAKKRNDDELPRG